MLIHKTLIIICDAITVLVRVINTVVLDVGCSADLLNIRDGINEKARVDLGGNIGGCCPHPVSIYGRICRP